ncbi:hypothetical protein [Shewanella sairae]|nr:hypothetical protein [Shewanella sairae]
MINESATVVIFLDKTRHQAALEYQSAEAKDVNFSLNNGADI